ncbi:MAG: heme lyase CcmF/NrfE family subunit [Peptococcaceae bacterium]|nr:heme lyase CcmF/NrfE family subunit [Peptococcaceae bacterium]
MAQLGSFSLFLGLAISLYGIVAFIISVQKKDSAFLASAKGAALAAAILSTVATAVLLYLLMTRDYSIQYVADYTSNDLPIFYRIAAWWAGNAGSILLWLFLLSWYTVIVAFSKKAKNLTPYASAIMLINSAFFFLILAFIESPFAANPAFKAGMDGYGMNPMLQNPGMVFHPFTLYLGYVGFAVPFAYAMTALITKTADDDWIKVTRRWTIVAWLFLSLGNLWGAQWAYMELGWGGYWGWDPVENASFIPWLVGSAFLHSVMIQERKDMLKVWNVILISLTYVLTLFGTFLVRSGVITSVHAFPSSPLGKYFAAFTIFMFLASAFLIIDRRKMLTKSASSFEALLSKESSFLMNNLVLVGFAFAVFFGTVYPLLSKAFSGVEISVGPSFFNSISAPLGLTLFALMGICPLIAWRKASIKNLRDNFLGPAALAIVFGIVLFMLDVRKPYALLAFVIALFTVATIAMEITRGTRVRHRLTGESYPLAFISLMVRNRRRHGGYIVHLGLVMFLIGVAGSQAYSSSITRQLQPNTGLTIGSYTLNFGTLNERHDGALDVVYTDLSVFENGQYVGTVEPQKVFYPTAQDQPVTEVGLRSTPKNDLYVILAGWEKNGAADLKVFVNPLVSWLWYGGYVVIFGAIFAMWPGKGSQTGSRYVHTERFVQSAGEA